MEPIRCCRDWEKRCGAVRCGWLEQELRHGLEEKEHVLINLKDTTTCDLVQGSLKCIINTH